MRQIGLEGGQVVLRDEPRLNCHPELFVENELKLAELRAWPSKKLRKWMRNLN